MIQFKKYPPGTMVILDGDSENIVKVIRQSPHNMFSEVMDPEKGSKWEVMTSRLSEIEPENTENK